MKTASATAAAITGTVAALSDRELLAQTGNLARVERHLQGAIIDHLAEIYARSLFEYAVRELGYSDAAAGRRIAAMRLCADNPQTRERLRDGSLSLSAAAELQWAFDRQKLVEEAAGKSTRQVKRMLADLDPELAAAADRVRPLGNGRYELKALIDAECPRGLEQLAGLLSHVDPRMTVGQLVGRLVREALDRHDPSRRRPRTGSRRAVRATSTAQTRPGCDGHAAPAPKSRDSGRAIPAAVKQEVWQRDGGRCRCAAPHTGRRCTSRHLLQIDHVLPYGLGGGSDPANLRLLCHAHHRHRHRSARRRNRLPRWEVQLLLVDADSDRFVRFQVCGVASAAMQPQAIRSAISRRGLGSDLGGIRVNQPFGSQQGSAMVAGNDLRRVGETYRYAEFVDLHPGAVR